MKDYFHRHTQFELFPGTVNSAEHKESARNFSRTLTIPLENFFVLAVVIIMGLVVAFSLGVERGKKIVFKGDADVTKPIYSEVVIMDQEAYAEVKSPSQDLADESLDKNGIEEKAQIQPEETKGTLAALAPMGPMQKKKLDISGEKLYTVQVASFRQEKYAQKEAASLKDKGYEIFVLPKGKYSIVCVGKFALKREAQSVSHSLKKQYKDCLIRSL